MLSSYDFHPPIHYGKIKIRENEDMKSFLHRVELKLLNLKFAHNECNFVKGIDALENSLIGKNGILVERGNIEILIEKPIKKSVSSIR